MGERLFGLKHPKLCFGDQSPDQTPAGPELIKHDAPKLKDPSSTLLFPADPGLRRSVCVIVSQDAVVAKGVQSEKEHHAPQLEGVISPVLDTPHCVSGPKAHLEVHYISQPRRIFQREILTGRASK